MGERGEEEEDIYPLLEVKKTTCIYSKFTTKQTLIEKAFGKYLLTWESLHIPFIIPIHNYIPK